MCVVVAIGRAECVQHMTLPGTSSQYSRRIKYTDKEAVITPTFPVGASVGVLL
jgi:hypothetical protein